MKAGNNEKTDPEAEPKRSPVRLDVALKEALGSEATRPPEPSAIVMLMVKTVMEAIARIGSEDPALAQRVGLALVGPMSSEPSVLQVKVADYADRIGFSERTVRNLIKAGLPTTGSGRRRRIPVQQADAWMLQQDAEHLDEIDLLAMKNAKKARGHGGCGDR